VLNAFTSNPNGVSDTDPSNDASLSNYEIEIGGFATKLELLTDCYGQETYWEIEDASSTVVAFGGNTSGIPPGGLQNSGNGDPGAYADNTLIEVTMCLAEGCYDFTIFDDWGDGLEGSASWGCDEDGNYQILNSSGTILGQMQNVAFGNSETINFCVVNNAGINELGNGTLLVYPNPNNGSFTVDMSTLGSGNKTIIVRDVTGREVMKKMTNAATEHVEISGSSSGIYFLDVQLDSTHLIKKITLEK
jgi:hypothetical protein